MSYPKSNILKNQKYLSFSELAKSKHCGRRPFMQKQWSVDHATFRDKHLGNFGGREVGDPTIRIEHPERPEPRIRAMSAVKKITTPHEIQSNINSSKVLTVKKDEQRVNINIFLSHNGNGGQEDTSSEFDCPSEIQMSAPSVRNSSSNPRYDHTKTSAESKRAQFRASRSNVVLDERRPKLIRAMSAPLRSSIDTDSWQLQSKRRVRNKKTIQESQRIAEELHEQKLFLENNVNILYKEEKSQNLKSRNKNLLQVRARSSFGGCDIVTLVSLLSPGTSDSEKEDTATQEQTELSSVRAPPLRRTEKSVSFQEHEKLSTEMNQKEFPTMLRRASIAPLAAKIRANRPPTAPPGSIYLRNYEIGENDLTTAELESTGSKILPEEITNLITSKISCGDSVKSVSQSQTIYPEYVRSDKEKECWMVFKKMTNRGVDVTYETIMRGMLTPTEVRVIESKQKAFIERQASYDAENSTDGKTN